MQHQSIQNTDIKPTDIKLTFYVLIRQNDVRNYDKCNKNIILKNFNRKTTLIKIIITK